VRERREKEERKERETKRETKSGLGKVEEKI
jgi:hypothetical protein